jgi:hypothetical protein
MPRRSALSYRTQLDKLQELSLNLAAITSVLVLYLSYVHHFYSVLTNFLIK